MSNSPHTDTVLIMDLILDLEPLSILDIGAGFGRWGFLCRCHLGDGESLTNNKDQALSIEAIEAYADNISPVYDAVYNQTHIGDARDVLPGLGKFDIVICSHVVEHMEKADGRKLIREMRQHASMAVIIGIPFNDPLRGGIGGNEYEAHRSVWQAGDFGGDAFVRTFPFKKDIKMGVIVYPENDDAKWQIKVRRNPLRAYSARAMRRLSSLCFLRETSPF